MPPLEKAIITNTVTGERISVMFNPAGQVVGQLDKVEKTRAVIQRLVEEYLDAVDRLTQLTEAANALVRTCADRTTNHGATGASP